MRLFIRLSIYLQCFPHIPLLAGQINLLSTKTANDVIFLLRHRNAVKFEFRTTEENGILFYGRRRHVKGELLALRLMGGDLYYKIHCSTVSADVLIPHRYKLNDGLWHSVVVSRLSSRWTLGLDHGPLSLFIVQELCESRGGRPGLSVLTSLLVSVDVKLY